MPSNVALLKQLEAKLQINEHALDEALREHPDLFYKVASELALAISNRDEAKQDLDETEAQVDIHIRSQQIEKTTEGNILSLKKIGPKVKAANDKLLEEKYNAAKWTALKEAYESRSYALSKLVDLYLASYYSSEQGQQKSQLNLRDAQAARVKEANSRVRVKV